MFQVYAMRVNNELQRISNVPRESGDVAKFAADQPTTDMENND